MKNIIIGTFVIMTIVLLLAGCAFDKLRLSIDHGGFTPLGGTNVVPDLKTASQLVL